MQFQVPQFIETEDKIIGPFTLKQFLFVGGAAGISFFFYFMLQTWLWAIISTVLVGAGVAFAFIKINGQPLTKISVAALFYFWKPQNYVWRAPEAPHAKKEEVIQSLGGEGLMEKIISGAILKNTWQSLQTGVTKEAKIGGKKIREMGERYQVFQRAGGERHAARRIDYRS